VLFVAAAFMSAASGFHTPALESLTPGLVNAEDLPAVSALTSLRGTAASIVGPSLAGLCIAGAGLASTFGLDALTYAFSLVVLSRIRSMPPADDAGRPRLSTIVQGIAYAASRPELIGTYVVDIAALSLAMPMAVFPALAAAWGGARAVGYLYSAMSAGAFAVSLLSGWTRGIERRGAAVVLAAATWGAAVAALGCVRTLPAAIAYLVVAGGADMLSAIFRMTIWNESIPSHLRGRMAGIEQLSYMTGPLLGNARAGIAAERLGLARSILLGGLLCVGAAVACVPILPAFWRYRASQSVRAAGEA
jgi:hypothetical protein